MKEKITGLEWRDFVGINLGISELIKNYQALIDSGSSLSSFWAQEIETLKATQKKINKNRSFEL